MSSSDPETAQRLAEAVAAADGRTPEPADDLTVARAVLATVGAIPEVSRISPGRFAQVATYGPGAAVHGVAISRSGGVLTIELHLVARYARTLVLPKLADRVRRSVRRIVEPLAGEPVGRIDISFDDLDFEGENPEDLSPPAEPAGRERIEAGL